MTGYELHAKYYRWMCSLVADKRYSDETYRKLLDKLSRVVFTYTIPMDGNRAEDGIDLRYRFGHENGYSDVLIATMLDNKPCTILEMMVALSVRIEEHIMGNPDLGDRTAKWFWEMISSLGLDEAYDTEYDENFVDIVLDAFLDHDYEPNGAGGLFTIENPPYNMRSTEIWYQMNCHINEVIDKGGIWE